METPTAQSALADADRLARRSRRSSRWYALYLVLYAVGTFAAAVIIGAVRGPVGVAVATTLWLLLVAGLTLYTHRQQATVKRFRLVHGLVIATWTSLWVITVLFGAMFFGDRFGWWLGGGIACALPPLVGALVVLRGTR